jgi:signal transduction histidine kinase
MVSPDMEVINVRDASRKDAYRELSMRRQLSITGYLAAPVPGRRGQHLGILAVLAHGPRLFADGEMDLVTITAALIGPRLALSGGNGERPSTPVLSARLADDELQEPLRILRSYSQMLLANEVAAAELPLIASRLAEQGETVVRVVDQALILARLPMELAFTVRVSLDAVVRSVAERIRPRMERSGIDLRLQMDASGAVWGDAALLEAALEEMLHNVFRHASGATTVQLRLRQSAADRFQVIVKDDGPGISADRLAELFGPLQPVDLRPGRREGMGLYLLRRVAEVHGGTAWANSLEGKGTTFYLELPAATPDGDSARLSRSAGQAPA